MKKLDTKTIQADGNGGFHATMDGKPVVIEELFPAELWDSPEAFKMAGITGYEPMTAKELDTEEAQQKRLINPNYIIEEKFDGTRALVYFLSQKTSPDSGEYKKHERLSYCRVFSRRISKNTGFYVENTDSLPQIREISCTALAGTILDGELFIDGLPFKEVASTLNCLWDKAIERQIEKGFVTLHAFDILFYRGKDVRGKSLSQRKWFLHKAIEACNSPYIKEVEYHDCGKGNFEPTLNEITKRVGAEHYDEYVEYLEVKKDIYPHLWECYCDDRHQHLAAMSTSRIRLTPQAYYELIVSTGGEGVMVKPKDGLYLHKRGWEYSKIKKFLTRELILVGFSEPTKEYTGKDIRKWAYWEEVETGRKVTGNFWGDSRYMPVTKFYHKGQIGNLLLGVLIHEDDYVKLSPDKRGTVLYPVEYGITNYEKGYVIMQVCECAGFDDDTRQYMTENKAKLVGSVVEVKANEIFKDSGKLRHPRFMRWRFDKDAIECTWENHIM